MLLGLWVFFALAIAPFACHETIAATRVSHHAMGSDSDLTAGHLAPGLIHACEQLKGHCPDGIGPGGTIPQALVSSPVPHAMAVANLAAVLPPLLLNVRAASFLTMTGRSRDVRDATGRRLQLRFLVTSPRLRN